MPGRLLKGSPTSHTACQALTTVMAAKNQVSVVSTRVCWDTRGGNFITPHHSECLAGWLSSACHITACQAFATIDDTRAGNITLLIHECLVGFQKHIQQTASQTCATTDDTMDSSPHMLNVCLAGVLKDHHQTASQALTQANFTLPLPPPLMSG